MVLLYFRCSLLNRQTIFQQQFVTLTATLRVRIIYKYRLLFGFKNDVLYRAQNRTDCHCIGPTPNMCAPRCLR